MTNKTSIFILCLTIFPTFVYSTSLRTSFKKVIENSQFVCVAECIANDFIEESNGKRTFAYEFVVTKDLKGISSSNIILLTKHYSGFLLPDEPRRPEYIKNSKYAFAVETYGGYIHVTELFGYFRYNDLEKFKTTGVEIPLLKIDSTNPDKGQNKSPSQ